MPDCTPCWNMLMWDSAAANFGDRARGVPVYHDVSRFSRDGMITGAGLREVKDGGGRRVLLVATIPRVAPVQHPTPTVNSPLPYGSTQTN